MRTIHKFPVEFEGTTTHAIPISAKFRHAEMQGVGAFMWWEVETDEVTRPREFQIYGTGHEIPRNGGRGADAYREWLATFQSPPFVWHLFEVIR